MHFAIVTIKFENLTKSKKIALKAILGELWSQAFSINQHISSISCQSSVYFVLIMRKIFLSICYFDVSIKTILQFQQ